MKRAARQATRSFNFQAAYDRAAMIQETVHSLKSFLEVPWWNADVVAKVAKYSKISLLHDYIYGIIAEDMWHEYRYRSDMYQDRYEHDGGCKEIREAFEAYEIPFSDFDPSDSDEFEGPYDPFYLWFLSQKDQFETLWKKMTDEVFHLLFADRTFLLAFNMHLAEFLRAGGVVIPANTHIAEVLKAGSVNILASYLDQEDMFKFRLDIPTVVASLGEEGPNPLAPYLDQKGVLKRCLHVPSWAKKAVYYRDHGRCVLCQTDLSGLLSTDYRLCYDHMVPLNLWGTNDPCNLQLLCEPCNLKKSGTAIQTGTRYPAWWDY